MSLLFVFSCTDDDDPTIVNEEELITTVICTLTSASGGETVQLSFTDLDGDGGGAPVIVGGTLTANTEYNGAVQFLDQSSADEENITEEVMEEDDEHQLFYSSTLNFTFTYSDEDANGNPLGLSFKLNTADAGDGNLTITLIHMPVKGASGVSSGDITNADGETDILVTFPITVQ